MERTSLKENSNEDHNCVSDTNPRLQDVGYVFLHGGKKRLQKSRITKLS